MAITQTSDLDAAATLAYNLEANWALRASTLYSSPMLSKKKPTNQTHRGSSVRFWFYDDLAIATTALTEDTDVTAGKAADSYIDVTITEYGAATGSTAKMIGTDMLEFDQDVAVLNARQLADSYEALARTAMLTRAGAYASHILYGGDATETVEVAAGDYLTASMIRKTVARLRAENVAPIVDDKYVAFISPYQSLDLREQTGDAAWLAPVNQQKFEAIANGYVGTFGGAVFYESSRVAEGDGDGAGSPAINVTKGHMIGQEAMAMAFSSKVSAETPQVRISPVVDKLQRFYHIGWYWLGGFKLFRPEASWQFETATSIQTA